MKIKLIKANANGNSFVLINQTTLSSTALISKKVISKICAIYNTDGLIIIDEKYSDIKIDYYNNDGSWETLCVNGLICAALQLQILNIQYNMECGDGLHKIEYIDNMVKVSMPEPTYKSKKININNISGYYIDSGAKHFVIKQNNPWPSNLELINLAKKIRYNTNQFPDGINVNFYKLINKDTIEVKTYEKGIEDLMGSCASGSFACAYHFHKENRSQSIIHINNPGGNYSCIFKDNYTNNAIISLGKLEFEKYFFLT